MEKKGRPVLLTQLVRRDILMFVLLRLVTLVAVFLSGHLNRINAWLAGTRCLSWKPFKQWLPLTSDQPISPCWEKRVLTERSMFASFSPLTSSNVSLPPALADYARREASLDADVVLDFLAEAERRSGETWERPVHFPAAFLLGLGAAMRVLRWEISRIADHLEFELPSASQLLRHLMRVCLEDTAEVRDKWVAQVFNRISEIAVNCFAWQGHTILSADVALGVADDDKLVDAIATFVLQLQEGAQHEPTKKN